MALVVDYLSKIPIAATNFKCFFYKISDCFFSSVYNESNAVLPPTISVTDKKGEGDKKKIIHHDSFENLLVSTSVYKRSELSSLEDKSSLTTDWSSTCISQTDPDEQESGNLLGDMFESFKREFGVELPEPTDLLMSQFDDPNFDAWTTAKYFLDNSEYRSCH